MNENLVFRTRCSAQWNGAVHRRAGTVTNSASIAIPGLQRSITCRAASGKRGEAMQ